MSTYEILRQFAASWGAAYFGLMPPDFPNQRFIQNADPRTVGVTVRYQVGHDEE